jgi:hypothetical protein
MTDLNGGALFNAEFGIKHRGNTVPRKSGVALSFCRSPMKEVSYQNFVMGVAAPTRIVVRLHPARNENQYY